MILLPPSRPCADAVDQTAGEPLIRYDIHQVLPEL